MSEVRETRAGGLLYSTSSNGPICPRHQRHEVTGNPIRHPGLLNKLEQDNFYYGWNLWIQFIEEPERCSDCTRTVKYPTPIDTIQAIDNLDDTKESLLVWGGGPLGLDYV